MDMQRLHSFTYLKNIDYFMKLFHPKLIKKILNQQFHNGLIAQADDDKLVDILNYEATLLAPNCDITKCQTAFGHLEIPELRKKLLHHDLNISRQALVSLLDAVHDPEKAVVIIRLNVLARIVRLMISEDTYTRQHALCFLRVLAGQPNGPQAIVQKKYILDNLKTALYDKHYFVRLQATLTCILLCRSWFAFNTLIKNCFVLHFMGRICFEDRDVILGSLLTALEHILDKSNRAKIQAIENHVCENLAEYLQHDDDFVRSEAHGVLIQVFTIPQGKTAAENCNIDIFSFLKKSLKDKDEDVVERAALALAYLFVTTPGKMRGVELNIMNDLLPLAFDSNNPRIIKNVLQALTNLAAAPSVKEKLFQCNLSSINKLNNQGNPELKKSIRRLLTVVTHKV